MLLPAELLTILFFATATTAFPQNASPANATAPVTLPAEPIEPIFAPDSPELQDPAAQPSDDPCSTESCWPVNFIPMLPTATGWDDSNNGILGPTNAAPPEQSLKVTTRSPTIINIRTSAALETPALSTAIGLLTDNNARPASTENRQPQQATSVHGTGNPNPQAVPDAPVPAPQQTVENDLLLQIISRMGVSQPVAPDVQSAPLSSPTGSDYEADDVPAQRQITPGLSSTGVVEVTSSPQTTLAVGGLVTLGSATLSLTPGLSTTVGTGTSATFIGITTDSLGQTFITVSSSGTAVTATVSDAPVTETHSTTDFGASITDAAIPGALSTSRTTGVAASTSSKSGAVHGTGEFGWWMGAFLGLLGTNAIL